MNELSGLHCSGLKNNMRPISFIHSGYFYSTFLSPLLLRGAHDYSIDTVWELTCCYMELSAGLAQPRPTCQLKWDLNLQLSGRKAPNLPLRHHTPHFVK